MDYRNTRSSYLNCEKQIYEGVGEFQFPEIEPIDMDVKDVPLVGFNYANTVKRPQEKICHFYLDDYQFIRLWYNPDLYLNWLSKFKAVLTPDFSMYMDFPKIVNMFQHYRKQWLGAYWQENGINVIPTIGFCGDDSETWCFDGIPRNALVCISTVGMFGKKEFIEPWLVGYKKTLEVLTPKKILFYGKLYPEIKVPDGIEYCVAPNQNLLNLKRLSKETQAKQAKKAMKA